MFSVERSTLAGVDLRFRGALDASTLREVRPYLNGDLPREVTLDFTEAGDLDYSRLVALIAYAAARGRRVRLRGLCSDHVRMLRYLGLDPTEFGIRQDRGPEEAMITDERLHVQRASEADAAPAPDRSPSRYPALHQANTRVWLTALSRGLGRPATLDDIPDAELERLAELGFEWLYLLSVWETGAAGREISRANPEWREEFAHTLPDLREEDIGGSGFAVTGYEVAAALGGDEALARLRERMRRCGLRLLLDFVPNHTALDHPWVEDHPEYYVRGSEADLLRSPRNYTWARRRGGDLLLAHGRDPYFPGWPDTLQLDYGNPALQEAMLGELSRVAARCDGVRCDMAMLVLPEVFERTWGRAARPFWPEAIRRVREQVPGFLFVAEVYWDLEWRLQQQGFDFTYDKRLYDRLREGRAGPVRDHLRADAAYQDRLARFLENHDEPRAAATFSPEVHRAAAVVTFLAPGLRFFHQGQLEGSRKRISPHLVRGPDEPVDGELHRFYERLLAVLGDPAVRDGRWQLLDCVPAWDGNGTHDSFVASAWEDAQRRRVLVAVNYSNQRSQCFVRLPFADLEGASWRLQDLLGDASYDRFGDDLRARGLYLDVPGWSAAAFRVTRGTP